MSADDMDNEGPASGAEPHRPKEPPVPASYKEVLALDREGADALGPALFQYGLGGYTHTSNAAKEANRAVQAHLDLLYPEAGPFTQAVEALWLTPEGPEKEASMKVLAAKFRTLAPNARIRIWSRLTANGVNHIDKARWVHRYLALGILEIFGVRPLPAYEAPRT